MTRFQLWLFMLKHWFLSGWFLARFEFYDETNDARRARHHEILGDAAADILSRRTPK